MAITSAVLLAASVQQQHKAGQAQKKSQRIGQRRADIQASRERREQVRQTRIRRAEILSEAANTGAGGSSSEAGAIGSLQGQLGGRLGASFETQALSQQQSRANISAVGRQTNANMFATLGSFSSSFITPSSPT